MNSKLIELINRHDALMDEAERATKELPVVLELIDHAHIPQEEFKTTAGITVYDKTRRDSYNSVASAAATRAIRNALAAHLGRIITDAKTFASQEANRDQNRTGELELVKAELRRMLGL